MRPDVCGVGLGTIDQLLPFQCSMSVRWPLPGLKYPTAKQLVLVGHEIADSRLIVPGAEVGTIAQLVPFHRSMNAAVDVVVA